MILIIDDDAVVRSSLSLLLKRAGYEAEAVSNPTAAIDFVKHTTPSLMLMDMNFSLATQGREGLELLQRVQIYAPDTPVILITAWGSIALAVKGMQLGAFDFVTKPWDNRQLLKSIETALDLRSEETTIDIPKNRKELDAQYNFTSIIGKSEALTNVLSTVARIANTNASVLITGDSGTGKELIAEAIHKNSNRRKNEFVKVNLGGLSQSLFESEMFGHKKGSFTDAQADRVGRFELADKGTIFLDEIGELDQTCQVKLLRVLQDQTFEPLGSSTPKKVDVRVVSATNANLQQMMIDKSFREDLFYRINLIQVYLPSLRERREDIYLLANHFANNLIKQNNLPKASFTPGALEFLERLPYPGNIRELKNLVERTILISGKCNIDAQDIQNHIVPSEEALQTANVSANIKLEELEEQSIRNAILQHNGNISKAARTLGISRPALYRRIEKYGI